MTLYFRCPLPLRLLTEVASNKDLLHVRRPSLEVISEMVHDRYWVGHDARRWCLEKPKRALGLGVPFTACRPKPARH